MSSFVSPEGLMMLFIAVICDLVSISASFIIGIIPCLVLDFLCLIIIGAWMYNRGSSVGTPAAEEEEEEEAPPDISKPKRDKFAESKAEGKGGAEKQAVKAEEKQAAKQAEKQATKQTAKTATKSGGKMVAKRASRKVLRRLIGSFIGTLVPLLQIVPFWTITVIGELKGEK